MMLVSGEVLIDTWWNVNDKFVQWWDDDEVVLIDTWWNVNFKDTEICSYDEMVLIDTWWNVNVCHQHKYKRHAFSF